MPAPDRKPSQDHRGTILLEAGQLLDVSHHDGQQCVVRIQAPRIAARCQPGCFIHLRCSDRLPMRRPMSVMRASPQGWIDVLFKVHGEGTRLLSERVVGDVLSVLGPIGQPFKLENYRARPLLIGGGVGIPPMVFLADHLRQRIDGLAPLVLMGSEVPFPFPARPSQIMVDGMPDEVIAAMPLLDDWGIASRLASNAGFVGCYEGHVTDLARCYFDSGALAPGDTEIFACGPTPMLRAVQQLAADYAVPAWLSLEEYMACAVGGCAGCTVKVVTPAGTAMKRVCVDGPVFDSAHVKFD